MKIAVNKAKDLLKKRGPILVDDMSLLDKSLGEDRDNLSFFLDGLMALTLDEKNIIILKIYFDYTFELIAGELNLSISTVKSRYYRALEKLRLEEGFYE